MRILKFRFWLEKEKKMCSWELMKKECNRLSILVQFTGLLDKQGVEIYEGDIVKFCDGVYVVEWEREPVVDRTPPGHNLVAVGGTL